MSGLNKTKTVPFRILSYLLYGEYSWIESLGNGHVRILTGPAARTLRIKSSDFWQYLYWLEAAGLLIKVNKEKKHGTAVIQLMPPSRVFANLESM